MNTTEKILNFVKLKNTKKEVQNIRGLVKTGENEWSFSYIFIDGDYLSMSKVLKVNLDSKTGKVSYVRKKKNKLKTKNLVTVSK